MAKRHSPKGFLRDRRGIAATEFALIAPALIFLVMGVLELTMRFRAKEEATRYVHQVADLVSRQQTLTTDFLSQIYAASVFMMAPLTTTDNLDLDVTSVGYSLDEDATPAVFWRRVAGDEVVFGLEDSEGLGVAGESVIRVGIRYSYESAITTLFGGAEMTIEAEAYARPRRIRLISMDGVLDDDLDGEFVTFN